MKELYENGPLVVSFEPDYNFMMYKSGIYHSIDEKTWMTNGVPKPEWEKVDHSVLLVGWGEDSNSGEKFWIIQNTWGESWGENGFFRMKRGNDEFGIESICEAADPFYIKNKNYEEKKPKESYINIEALDNYNYNNNEGNANNFLGNKFKNNQELVKNLNEENDFSNSSSNSIFDELTI